MKALMNPKQKEMFLNNVLPTVLPSYSLSTICRMYPITRKTLKNEIMKIESLRNMYIRYHGLNGEKRIRTKNGNYVTKTDYSNGGYELYQKDLDQNGVRNLAVAIINDAIRQKDTSFFDTEWCSMWQFFATGSFDETLEIKRAKERMYESKD